MKTKVIRKMDLTLKKTSSFQRKNRGNLIVKKKMKKKKKRTSNLSKRSRKMNLKYQRRNLEKLLKMVHYKVKIKCSLDQTVKP